MWRLQFQHAENRSQRINIFCALLRFLSVDAHVSSLTYKRCKWNSRSSPCHDDKEIQSVPRVPEVTTSSKDSQGDHLYNHLQSKEDVDECIKSLTERHKDTKRQGIKNEKGRGLWAPQSNIRSSPLEVEREHCFVLHEESQETERCYSCLTHLYQMSIWGHIRITTTT